MDNRIYRLLNDVRMDFDEYEEVPLSAKEIHTIKKNLKRRIGRRRIRPAAVAACLILFCVTGSVISYAQTESGPVKWVRGLLAGEENISEYVKETVFTDSDEHLKVEVEELLSDGQRVFATVRYEALDEQGQQWLSKVLDPDLGAKDLAPDEHLTLLNRKENGIIVYSMEVDEYRTDVSRTLFVGYETGEMEDSDVSEAVLTYQLTDGEHSTKLDTVSNLPWYSYKLTAENGEKISDNYEVTRIQFSKLSFTIYGRLTYEKLQEVGIDDLEPEDWQKIFGETVGQIYMIQSDGAEIPVGTGAGMFGASNQAALNGDGSEDYIVYASGIFNLADRLDKITDVRSEINPEDIVGIRIAGDAGDAGYGGKSVTYYFD